MTKRGTITQDAEGSVQWKVKGFTSLKMNEWYSSPSFFYVGGAKWCLFICRVCPEGHRSGQHIELQLVRCSDDGPLPVLDVEYMFSVQSRDGHRHGERRNRMKFEKGDWSPLIGIELEEERMSDLVPGDTLTILCRLERIDPTRGVSATSNCSYCGGHFDAGSISSHQGKCLDKPIRCPECSEVVVLRNWYDHQCHSRSAQEAAQLKEKLQQNTAELASVRRELAENQSELVRLQRLVEQLNLKVIDLEADRDNAQKLLQTKTEASASGSMLHKTRLHQDLKRMFLDQHGDCDIIIRVKEREFKAHGNILKARSPVFASTLCADMKEKAPGIIDIDDLNPSAFSVFLHFLYFEEVDNLSAENVFDLYAAADKYDVPNLRSMCVEFMRENLCVDTFCDVMRLALLHSKTELISLCTDFFIRNATKIIKTVQWQRFIVENPTESNELFLKFATSVERSSE